MPGHQLFDNAKDGSPRIRGIGYGTAKKARESIRKIRKMSKAYKKQVATTMYNRAKYHKYQNQDMRQSMKVWNKYLMSLR
jgi:hypothetical protein